MFLLKNNFSRRHYSVFLTRVKYKYTLVLKGRQEGQGIYQTLDNAQPLEKFLLPRRTMTRQQAALVFRSLHFLFTLPPGTPGTHLPNWCTSYQSHHDASLHSSQPYNESYHPGCEAEKRCVSHRPSQKPYLFGIAYINRETVLNFKHRCLKL